MKPLDNNAASSNPCMRPGKKSFLVEVLFLLLTFMSCNAGEGKGGNQPSSPITPPSASVLARTNNEKSSSLYTYNPDRFNDTSPRTAEYGGGDGEQELVPAKSSRQGVNNQRYRIRGALGSLAYKLRGGVFSDDMNYNTYKHDIPLEGGEKLSISMREWQDDKNPTLLHQRIEIVLLGNRYDSITIGGINISTDPSDPTVISTTMPKDRRTHNNLSVKVPKRFVLSHSSTSTNIEKFLAFLKGMLL